MVHRTYNIGHNGEISNFDYENEPFELHWTLAFPVTGVSNIICGFGLIGTALIMTIGCSGCAPYRYTGYFLMALGFVAPYIVKYFFASEAQEHFNQLQQLTKLDHNKNGSLGSFLINQLQGAWTAVADEIKPHDRSWCPQRHEFSMSIQVTGNKMQVMQSEQIILFFKNNNNGRIMMQTKTGLFIELVKLELPDKFVFHGFNGGIYTWTRTDRTRSASVEYDSDGSSILSDDVEQTSAINVNNFLPNMMNNNSNQVAAPVTPNPYSNNNQAYFNNNAPPSYSDAPPAYNNSEAPPAYSPDDGNGGSAMPYNTPINNYNSSNNIGEPKSIAEQIQALNELKIQGIITEEEFTSGKTKILHARE